MGMRTWVKGFVYRLLERHDTTHRSKMVCVGLKGGRVVGYGYNSVKTHPAPVRASQGLSQMYEEMEKPWLSKSIHAEVGMLMSCQTVPDTAVVGYLMADGSLGTSKPCLICQKILSEAGVSRALYYDKDTESWQELRFS